MHNDLEALNKNVESLFLPLLLLGCLDRWFSARRFLRTAAGKDRGERSSHQCRNVLSSHGAPPEIDYIKNSTLSSNTGNVQGLMAVSGIIRKWQYVWQKQLRKRG